MMKWSVARHPVGLTVNRAQNLLVVCQGESKLQEYTTHGTLLQNIQLKLHGSTAYFRHAVDLASGQFVVSCGAPLHGICLVNVNGTVIQSYGGQRGSQMTQMNDPAGLAVDRHANILVADMSNNKLLVLDRSLTSAHKMSVSVDGGLTGPWSLCYDKSRGRLYIGEWNRGRVIVIDT